MLLDESKPESMVTDASILVLAEKVGGIVNDIGEIKSSLKILPDILVRVGGIEKDVAAATQKANQALTEVEATKNSVSNVREVVGSNGRTWKILGSLALAFSGGVGVFYTQWHPWMDDIAKARDQRNTEIATLKDALAARQNQTDSRLAVLEFRASNPTVHDSR